MKTSTTLYVGIKGRVLALDRASGAVLWQTELKGSDFVNVAGDEAGLFAMTYGELFCLDSMTGEIKWHNPLKGLGTGLASVLVPGWPGNQLTALVAERRKDQQAAAAASGAAAGSAG